MNFMNNTATITSLHPKVLLKEVELRRISVLQKRCGHLSCEDRAEAEYQSGRVYNSYLRIAAMVESAFRRSIGLEKNLVVRIRSEFHDEVSLQIQGLSICASHGPRRRNDAAWQLYGNPLLNDGMPSNSRMCAVNFTEARIERRGLDGQWGLLVDTLPRKHHAS